MSHSGQPQELLPLIRDSASGCAAAARSFRRGETIDFLAGEMIDTAELMRRIAAGEATVDDPLQFAPDGYFLLCDLHKRIAHSCAPNAGVNGVNRLFALEDIKAGSAVSIDFSTVVGLSHFDALWEMKCSCQKDCRQTIKSIRSLSRAQLKYYVVNNALPRFIVRQLAESACRQTF